MPQIHPRTVTVKGARDLSGLTPVQIDRACEAGLIASVFAGERRLVYVDSLNSYVDSLPTVRPAS